MGAAAIWWLHCGNFCIGWAYKVHFVPIDYSSQVSKRVYCITKRFPSQDCALLKYNVILSLRNCTYSTNIVGYLIFCVYFVGK